MGRGTYTVSYVRRLADPTLSVGEKDPMKDYADGACYPHESGVARCADAATGNQCGGVTGETEISQGTGVGGVSEAQ